MSSTSASIQWQAPPITNPHNLPLMYTLLLLEEQFGLPSISLDIDSSHTTYTFTQLEEFNTYTCTIYLVNEVGTGLPSSISFTTQEDGMYISCATVDREIFAKKYLSVKFCIVLFSSPRHTGSVASLLLFDVEK